jgi:predicted protein tyrosine phosphatase
MPIKILFICSENRLRSPTAEAVFSQYDNVEAISAGTNRECKSPVSGDLIEWADAILVMEDSHRDEILKRFPDLLRDKKLAVLDIPDMYPFMDPLLVELLETRGPLYVHIS